MRHWLIGAALVGMAAAVLPTGRPAGAQEAGLRFRHRVIAFGTVANGTIAADFNGDGRLDVAAAGPEDVSWYERTIGGSFWRKHLIQARGGGETLDSICLRVFDMDGDGDQDLVSLTLEKGRLGWYENPGSGDNPWEWRLIDRLPTIHSHALEDLNRDGRPEIVANTQGAIVWYSIPRDSRKMLPASYSGDAAGRSMWERKYLARSGVTGTPHYLNFGDMDGDGDRDLCTGVPDTNQLVWWERPEDATLLWSKHVVKEMPGPSHFMPRDMNQDGQMDLFYGRGHSAGFGYLPGPGFTEDHVIDADTLPEPHALTVADLDGDGDLDVVAVARKTGGLAAWINDGKGSFTRRDIDPQPLAMDVSVVDLDGDGDRDILVAGATAKNVTWFENLKL